MKRGGLPNKRICEKKQTNNSNEKAETVDFHFSNYKLGKHSGLVVEPRTRTESSGVRYLPPPCSEKKIF